MRTLFTFTLLSAIAFSGVAVGQEDITKEIDQIALKAAKTFGDSQVSVIDLDEPAPSDAEIDSARHENTSVVEGTQTVATEYNQFIDQGVVYPENIVTQDCCCQPGSIAPVVYQEPIAEAASELVGSLVPEGSLDPVADAASVVESPIIESAPVYAGTGVVTEGDPIAVQGDPIAVQGNPIVTGTPSCGCNQAAAPAVAPTEGLISSSPVNYQSAPVIYSSPAPAAAPCCPPARRGFFRRLMGR